MTGDRPSVVRTIVETLAPRPEVAAIALGGSRTAIGGDAGSDHDLYLWFDAEIPLDVRRDLAERFDSSPEIDNRWFGPGDEWADGETGVAVDLIYWERAGFEHDLRSMIQDYRPSLGYSTAFWHTVRHAQPLHDRDGWLAHIQELAATPYPDPLREAIVAWNWPLLRTNRSSYLHQIELAIGRDDPVSVQHRLTALLASLFDILFAVNRTLHPGEKRLLDHIARLDHGAKLAPRIRTTIHAAADPARLDLLGAIDDLCDELDRIVRDGGLADVIDRAAVR